MKKNIIYIFTSVLTFSLGFTSCISNDYEDALNTEISSSKTTRASYTVTYDDIQARVDELHKKYNSGSSKINREQPIEIFDEDFFLMFENLMRKDAGLEPLEKSSTTNFRTYTLWNDTSINEITIASTTDDEEEDDGNDDDSGPLDPINFEGEYTKSNVGFYHEDISTSIVLSAFNHYFFDITYHIKYSSDVSSNKVTFVDFSDETNYIKTNIYDNWLEQSPFLNLSEITNEDMDNLSNTYKLSYVEGSFGYLGNILQKDEESTPNPNAESLWFDYYFEMMMGNTKIRALMSHPGGIINIWKVNK